MTGKVKTGWHGSSLGAAAQKPNPLKDLARSLYRILTYSPLALWREQRALKQVLANWSGQHIFLFPYMHVGGAEQVHTDIAGTISDRDPLIIIHGFSKDRKFEKAMASAGTILELPRSLGHPFTRKRTLAFIAKRSNTASAPVLFGALSGVFFELIPFLRAGVRTIYLQHAFLYQPEGNLKHKEWLVHWPRLDHFIFIAQHARDEFKKLLRAQAIPDSTFNKLLYIPNAVDHFADPLAHDQDPIGVLFVGRDSPEKRVDLFLRIAERTNELAPGRFRFTLAGPEERPANAAVELKGMITGSAELARIYQQHDILLITSAREGFPMVIMEAMAAGMAVISTPVGDVPNRISAETGCVTTSMEEDAVLEEIVRTLLELANDRERLSSMRHAAFLYARSEFDPGRFRDHYRSLLIGPGAPA